jgi:hypothetical protein
MQFPNQQVRQQRRSSLLILALVSFVISFILVRMLLNSDLALLPPHRLGTGFEIAAALLLCWMLIITALWVNYRGKFDPLEFPIWYGWNTYLQIIFNVWFFQGDFFFYSSMLRNSGSNWAVSTVILIGSSITVLWIAYAIVYHLRMKKIEARTRLVGDDEASIRYNLAYIFWFATLIVQMFTIVSGASNKLQGIQINIEIWSNYFASFEAINLLLSFILLLRHFKQPTRFSRLWLIILLITQILFPLIIGSKASVLAMLYIGMVYFYSHRRFVSSRLVLVGVVGVVILSFTVPIAVQTRIALRNATSASGELDTAKRFELFQSVALANLQNPLDALFTRSSDVILQRQSGIFEMTGAAILVHPAQIGYLGDQLLAALPSMLLPRFLYPDKLVGRLDIYDTTGLYLDAKYVFFSGIGPFGDAYRLGGPIFVVIWMSFLGVFGAYAYTLGPSTRSLRFISVYLLLISYNGALAYSIYVFKTLSVLLYYVLPSLAVLYLITRPQFLKERNRLKSR